MFKLRITLPLLMLAAAIALLPAAGVTQFAQAGGMWSAWIHNNGPGSNAMLRIYQDGTTYETELPMPQDSFLYGMPTFNDDGELVAYCVLNPQAGQVSLHVQGVGENAASVAAAHQMSIPFVYELGGVAACEAIAFSRIDNSQVALTVVNYFPGSPDADASLPAWSLYVLDLKTGAVAHTLDAHNETLSALVPPDDTILFVPVTMHFSNTLIFRMMPYGVGRPAVNDLDAYEWDMAARTFTPNERYRPAMLDLHTPVNAATGEITGPPEAIWPVVDDTLPVAQPNIPMPPLNALMYDGGSGDPYPVYQLKDTALMLGDARFVAGGQYVALALPAASGESTIWRALGRDGALFDLPIGEHYFKLFAAPQGYAFLEAGEAPRLVYHIIGDDGTVTESVLWEGAGSSWAALWSAPVPGTAGLPPFPSAQQ